TLRDARGRMRGVRHTSRATARRSRSREPAPTQVGHYMTNVTTIASANTAGAESTDIIAWTALLQRIQREYREMPGLAVTLEQAARLWGLSLRQSERLLAELVRRGFLMREVRGAFRRSGCPRCS